MPLRRSTAPKAGAKPTIAPLGKNGALVVARRLLREEAFVWLTPKIRDVYTARMASTFAGQGRVNGWVRLLPPVPRAVDRRRYAPIPVWRRHRGITPTAWRRAAGVRRDEAAADAAWRERPLHDFVLTHVEAFRYLQQYAWNFISPSLPRMLRGYRGMRKAETRSPARPAATDAATMSRLIREEARRLGLSAVGFTRHDPRYTFAEFAADQLPNAIVCVVEQDYEATQTLPSGRAERSAFRAYAELIGRVGPLADFIARQGYRARPEDFAGHTMVIHYGVEAGLGQLGLNGQLLTPQAGSRCRLALITTDAPVEYGAPVDYGIEALCDSCQACVRRCPVGAIPKARREHRGVTKAKIKTERCLPTMIQTHGCAVCMKVCPVQRYGLEAVQEHFEDTGEILGKGSDELEGYAWPLDGRYYPATSKPRVGAELINPPGFEFDKTRAAPRPDGGSPFDL